MKLKTFVEPNSQVVVGNLFSDTDLPKEVVSGPNYVFGQRRVYCTISTKPQWLTFLSKEAPTATQIPVQFEFDCNWTRNLMGLSREQLFNISGLSHGVIEGILQSNIERFARYFVGRYPAQELVATPETTGPELSLIKRNQTLIHDYLLHEIRERLGGLGIRVNSLEVTISLPARLQREIEHVWQLRQSESHLSALTELNFAQAIAQSQPTFNFIASDTSDEKDQPHLATTMVKALSIQKPHFRLGV